MPFRFLTEEFLENRLVREDPPSQTESDRKRTIAAMSFDELDAALGDGTITSEEYNREVRGR